MRKKIRPYGNPTFLFLAMLAILAGFSLFAEEKKLNIVDLVKLQNPTYYAKLQELKNTPEAGTIDIPNGYISTVFGTGAGNWGDTYVVYYPEGRGALLAHTSVEPEKIVTEFFEHKNGKMVKIKSLLPALDCASSLSAEAQAFANKLGKKKNWVKNLHFIYKLPREGTTITGSCDGENNGTQSMTVLSEAGVDSSAFNAALEKELRALFTTVFKFHWDKKTGTFTQAK